MTRRIDRVRDVDLGIMVTTEDKRYVLDHHRDVVAEIVKCLRQSHENQWEFAKVPTWVLREVHDVLTHANTRNRFRNIT
jgi:hypothetical protein